jgi:hypothetical protein
MADSYRIRGEKEAKSNEAEVPLAEAVSVTMTSALLVMSADTALQSRRK